MSFPALYPGRCAECDGPIKTGEQIESSGGYNYDKTRRGFAPRYKHAECPEAAELAPIRPGEKRCNRCGAHHPGEC